MATFEWNGPQIVAKMAEAAALGIDKTMSDCVTEAKRVHPYVNRDDLLERSTQITDHASVKGGTVQGTWGATAPYALFIEIGTSRIGRTAEERAGEGDGNMWEIPDVLPGEGEAVLQSFTIVPLGDDEFITKHTPSVMHGNPGLIAPRPFLRPAADVNYPKLGINIGMAFRGEKFQ